MNYNVIQNLKNFEEIFGLNQIKLYEKMFKEGKKYISFLHNIRADIDQANLLTTNFKTLNEHRSTIHHLLQLKDGRLVSCSDDYTLNIYKKDTFELLLSIKESSHIYFFIQLKNDKIITCSYHPEMTIIKLNDENKYNIEQKLAGHGDFVCSIVEIRENELISISGDKTMKKWELKNNKFECTKTVTFQNSRSFCTILKVNENEFVTSSQEDKYLKFWNLNDCSNIATINNIETESTRKVLHMIKEDVLCVGGANSKGFYLINIQNHQLIKNILGPQVIYSINECLDGLFICSIINENSNHTIVKYKYENENMKKIIEKEKPHEANINACIELSDGSIASGGSGKTIKIWTN